MTNYQKAKQNLKDTADMAKSQFSDDKPMIRAIINDSIDNIVSEYDLNDSKRDLLCNYACTLHPKN